MSSSWQSEQAPRRSQEYRAGAAAVAPLAVAIAILGVVFGYQARAAGWSPLAATLMSGTIFAGSAQFAAVAVERSGGSVAAAVAAATLLNARCLVMGTTIAPVNRGNPVRRFLLAQLVVDETWVVANRADGTVSMARLVGAGLLLYPVHVTSTALGAIGGTFLGDPSRWGLDAAFPALFIALLWPHVRRPQGRRVAALATAVTLGLTPFLAPGLPILAAALVPMLTRPSP